MIECFLIPVCVVLAALVISGIGQEDDASTTGPHWNDRFASGPNVKGKSVRRTNMKDNSASGKRVKYTSNRENLVAVEERGDAREYVISNPEPVAAAKTKPAIVLLDQQKLNELRVQTALSQQMLSEIFVTEDEVQTAAGPQEYSHVIGVLQRLFEKPVWNRSEIQALCTSGTMVGNLLEQINDYSYSKIEDVVVEEIENEIYVTIEYKEYLL